ncbi:MAG: squalene/phytoene synthase family protein, partial [Gammaproteobacteria bacterium]|nr:squalene/phytoene synthase family protein [Gammaproteobacteria bacterium]
GMREDVSLAYLLARAADTLADSPTIEIERRLQLIQTFQTQTGPAICKALAPAINSEEISMLPHAGEKILLEKLPLIFQWLNQLDLPRRRLINQVLHTLLQGMMFDLLSFQTNTKSTITCLTQAHELETYTYNVAGCVGEFWTEISLYHFPQLKSKLGEKQTQEAIKFGKALQLTNILRDLRKDMENQRCYLPQHTKTIDAEQIEQLLKSPEFHQQKQIWLDTASNYFSSAENYLLSLPRLAYRLRLAALWPLIIGLATLSRIQTETSHQAIKVNRRFVYLMMFKSLTCVLSNTCLRRWMTQYRR